MTIVAFGAALSHDPGLGSSPHLRITGPLNGDRTTCPCAAYAQAACQALGEVPAYAALVTLVGPTGAVVSAFDNAWKRSKDGRLTGGDFADSRYRRIHPLTLLRSLQNQTPAVISMTCGLQGPCLNLLESPTGLAYSLPNIHALLLEHGAVLLVLAAAGGRDEEVAKLHALQSLPSCESLPDQVILMEGAVCFLLTQADQGFGTLAAVSPADPHSKISENKSESDHAPVSPVLKAGLDLLKRVVEGRPADVMVLSDPNGHTARIQWRPTCRS